MRWSDLSALLPALLGVLWSLCTLVVAFLGTFVGLPALMRRGWRGVLADWRWWLRYVRHGERPADFVTQATFSSESLPAGAADEPGDVQEA